ncbi:hypothetical protein NNJEOMEG_00605 [Fundidesulfovibrio magnetotacticus]|uniref:Uncharacterized protein n=1 Tax=Fundidesulfovibrio magnetotacticus TaxID=2730080 RepID=A0A6V8LR07_9BACT|nr:hypothetical protein [Fundidesulfovibrio magnetotacticus]GFK92778.1 hypothetical protein NNJEOMEG_00605 [Fundidesulfovibrio magnetotacticus]
MSARFDPSLLYAECRRCKSPVLSLLPPDETVLQMGVPPELLDADCLLLYEGCPHCQPGRAAYQPRLVRLLPSEGHRAGLH